MRDRCTVQSRECPLNSEHTVCSVALKKAVVINRGSLFTGEL